jgi:putative membrane protein insertion efficiency factor
MSGNDDLIKEVCFRSLCWMRLCRDRKFHVEWELNRMTELSRLWMGARQVPRLAGRALVKLYRVTLSPLIGMDCRYLPTCSEYADHALERHGLWAGGWMTLARLMRCHPWGNSGLDFVPEGKPQAARWYMPWRYGRWRGTNPAP